MPITIEPYRREHEPSVAEFNRRLQAGGEEIIFFREAEPHYLSPAGSDRIYQEQFVALEDGVVRGGYGLKRQPFQFPGGSVQTIGYYHHCLSEGIINQAYARVGSILLMHAMRRDPLLYCLGMGGYGRPLPNMLIKLGWSHCLIPFYLRVLRPARFLRHMEGLRSSAMRRAVMDVGAFSGSGWAAMKAFQAMQSLRAPKSEAAEVEEFSAFGDWADGLWEDARSSYGLVAVRDAASLRVIYPPSFTHLTRLKVSRGGRVIGWAVVAERRKNPRWGDLRIGTIVDAWAAPQNALAVVRAATRALQGRGLDAIVSNQSHDAWRRALEDSGFVKASSNFIFAAGKKLAEQMGPFDQAQGRMHFNRGDGDGLPWAY